MTMSVECQKWINQQRMLMKLRRMKALREISDHKQQILVTDRRKEGEEFVDDYQKTVRDS